MAAVSYSSSYVPRSTYDVFLSFRGEDTTSNNFVDHLYAALVQEGIGVFRHGYAGQTISEDVVKAIKESRFAVIVFSKHYANSSLCLEELSTIMECHDQMMGYKVLPVFYHVDPSDVRKQNGDFATAFQTHEHKFKGEMDKVNKWREAVTAAASLSGQHISPDNGGEAAFTSKIVKEILADIQPRGATWENQLVGIDIDALISLLKIEAAEEVRIVGIWGMGGIGKTTIAGSLFRRIAHKFEGSSFVAEVRKNSSSINYICRLQEHILDHILGERHGYKIKDRHQGAKIIQEKCCRKKVLLVLDDVNDVEQLEFLAATRKWFGPGSRIIITTRDRHLLSYANANDIYQPALLSMDDAVELFSAFAFNKNSPPEGYEELSIRAIRSTGGLPLALKVLGSFFLGFTLNEWESALHRLVEIPIKEIYDTLKLSYDDLNVYEKKVFLHIACFYKGKDVDYVVNVLDSFGFHPLIGIRVLVDKSLITISSDKTLDMHDLIQQMGRKVVHDSAPNSRLWTYDVFLSFTDKDSHFFVNSLYDELVRRGQRVLKDDKKLSGGQLFLEERVKAIEDSRFVVVVFSKNYANSYLCLEELSTIMECQNQKKVLPVFYYVDPTDVWKQNGDFATAFETHQHKFKGEMDKVNKWREAVTAATSLSGQHISPDNGVASAVINQIVETIRTDLEISEHKIGKIIFSKKKIGTGSNGTIVLEGSHDTRPAAVKRIVKEHHDVAKREIQNLIDSDRHPNIVRYYGVEYGQDFVYIALEHCICSLHELILAPTNPTVDQSQLTLLEAESFKVREPIEYPSPELLKVMRDTIAGLAHLHKLGFIHRDLKPQNVLIRKDNSSMIRAKVSDMGISKRLTADKSSLTNATGYGSSGWQAPETLRNERQTCAVDLFSLGCLLFFCITGGHHPFGDDMHERDINIKKDLKDLSLLKDIPEAFDLVSNLIQSDPKSRPTAGEVYNHPLFWKPDKRLKFFHEVKKHFQNDESVLKEVESIGKVDFNGEWKDKVDDRLLKKAKYDFHKVSELIRLIRNKVEHFMELPEDFRAQLGDVSTGLEAYFRVLFPNLLMKV